MPGDLPESSSLPMRASAWPESQPDRCLTDLFPTPKQKGEQRCLSSSGNSGFGAGSPNMKSHPSIKGKGPGGSGRSQPLTVLRPRSFECQARVMASMADSSRALWLQEELRADGPNQPPPVSSSDMRRQLHRRGQKKDKARGASAKRQSELQHPCSTSSASSGYGVICALGALGASRWCSGARGGRRGGLPAGAGDRG